MSGTLCCQKHRHRGEKGQTHELIGPWQSRAVPCNVLMASGSDRSHWKLCQVALRQHKASVRNRGPGQRNVTQNQGNVTRSHYLSAFENILESRAGFWMHLNLP